MTDSVLKPCPFCGGDAAEGHIEDMDHPDHGGYFIQCTDARCGASTALRFASGDDPSPLLREQWNRRVPPLDLTSEAVAVKLVHEIEKLSWTVESVDELTNEGMTEIVLAVLAKIKELQQ